jgi:hypothetical protein
MRLQNGGGDAREVGRYSGWRLSRSLGQGGKFTFVGDTRTWGSDVVAATRRSTIHLSFVKNWKAKCSVVSCSLLQGNSVLPKR